MAFYPTGRTANRHHHQTKADAMKKVQLGPGAFLTEDFGLAASDKAFLESDTMMSRVPRVQRMSCHASSGAMQSAVEADKIDGLNAKLEQLRASDELEPELRDIASRAKFLSRLIGGEWFDGYVAVTCKDGVHYVGMADQYRQRYYAVPNGARGWREVQIHSPRDPSWKVQDNVTKLNQLVVLTYRNVTVLPGGQLLDALRCPGAATEGSQEQEEEEEEDEVTLNSIPGLDLLAVAEAQLDAAEREAHEVAEAAGLQEESGDEEEEEEEQQQQPSCAVTEADCSGSATAQRYFRLSHTEVSKVARPCHSMTQLVKEILGIIHRGEVSWLPVNRCAAEGLPEPHWLDSPNDRKAAKVVLHLRPYLEEAVAPLGVEVLINRQELAPSGCILKLPKGLTYRLSAAGMCEMADRYFCLNESANRASLCALLEAGLAAGGGSAKMPKLARLAELMRSAAGAAPEASTLEGSAGPSTKAADMLASVDEWAQLFADMKEEVYALELQQAKEMCEENEERPAKRVRLDGKWSAEEDEELVTKAFELTHQLCGKGRLITDYSALGKALSRPAEHVAERIKCIQEQGAPASVSNLPTPPPSSLGGRSPVRLLDPRTTGADCLLVNAGRLPTDLTIRIAGAPYRTTFDAMVIRYQLLLVEDREGNLYLPNISGKCAGWPLELGWRGLLAIAQHGETARGHRWLSAAQAAPFKLEASNNSQSALASALRSSMPLRLMRAPEQTQLASTMRELDLALTALVSVKMHAAGAGPYREGFSTGLFSGGNFDYEAWRQEQEKRVPAMKGPLDEVLAIGIFDLQATATALDQSRRRARAAGLQPPQEVYNSRLRAARYFKGNLSHSELAKQAKAKLLADAAAANIQASYLPKRKSSNKDWSWVDQVEQQLPGFKGIMDGVRAFYEAGAKGTNIPALKAGTAYGWWGEARTAYVKTQKRTI